MKTKRETVAGIVLRPLSLAADLAEGEWKFGPSRVHYFEVRSHSIIISTERAMGGG